MNKKGQYLGLLLIIILIGTVLWGYKQLNIKGVHSNNIIGEKQFKLFQLYTKGERVINFIEHNAKIASQDIIYTLAKDGGYKGASPCGVVLSYNLWNNNIECYPTKITAFSDFTSLLDKSLNQKFQKYTFASIPENNYDYTFFEDKEKTEILGIALQDLYLPSKPEKSTDWNKQEIDYSKSEGMFYILKPSFHISLKYSFSDYDIIKEELTRPGGIISQVLSCEDQNELNDCVRKSIDEVNQQSNFKWNINEECVEDTSSLDGTRIFLFCVEQTKISLLTKFQGNMIAKHPVYKFGILFGQTSYNP